MACHLMNLLGIPGKVSGKFTIFELKPVTSTREHPLNQGTSFSHVSNPNFIKSKYPRGTQYIINVILVNQFQHNHIYISKYQCILQGKTGKKGTHL